jgi:hypothetical protein
MIHRIKQIGLALLVAGVLSLIVYVQAQPVEVSDLERYEANWVEQLEVYTPDVNEQAINGINLEQLHWEKANLPPEEEELNNKSNPEPPLQVSPKETIEVTPVVQQSSSVRDRSFLMNDGTYMTGAQIIDEAMGNTNARKLWDQFNLHFGGEVANNAIISLKFENGSYWERTTGVCDSIHWINGDYRNCAYPDMNSAGFDVGLKQINTFYQSGGESWRGLPSRFAKLGGPTCQFNSVAESKDRNHPCNQELMNWLYDVDNNIHMAIDIYAESGFCPWYGARKSGIINC